MIAIERKKLERVLESLKEAHYKIEHKQNATKRGQSITAIEEALAQPSNSVEQEPVNIVLDSWDAWASSTEYDNQNHDLLSALKDIKEALAQPSDSVEQEPWCWRIDASNYSYFGETAELEARHEAKRIGGTCKAFPLYTATPTAHTGWNNGLLQDYDKKLGAWFSEKPNAKEELRARTFDDYGNKIV